MSKDNQISSIVESKHDNNKEDQDVKSDQDLDQKSEENIQNKIKSTKKVFPRNPMPVWKPKPKKPTYVRKQISNNGVRLDKLTFGTLRRYQYFFKMDKKEGAKNIDNKEELIEAVEEHFMNELKIDPIEVIQRFLQTKKDPDQGMQADNYFLRATRQTRAGGLTRKDL